MIEAYDVRNSGRKSDCILNSLNGLHDRKLAGALARDEFANNIIDVSDLVANAIKIGKVGKEDIESVELHLTHLISDNADKYYSHPHTDLQRAGKTSLESIDFAKAKLNERYSYSQPVMDADSYTKTFRKLG